MARAPVEKIGTCRMCLKAATLERGHIIPAFVYRWQKDTSATGYLRTGTNPNLRVQDGERRYWFCRRCEDTMSRFERPYAEQLFPLVVSEAPAPYSHGPWLSRFLASVALRVLMRYAEERDAFEFFTAEQAALVPETLQHWRAFVLGEVETPGIHDLHFVPMGVLGRATGNLKLPPNFNRYLLLSTEMHVASNSAQAFVYVKMGPSLAFGLIHPPSADQWIGTRVAIGDGHVGGRMGLSARVLEYLFERAENVHVLNKRRSARQEQKIVQAMRANPERFAASKTHRAFAADIEQFGIERVFPPDEDAHSRRPT